MIKQARGYSGNYKDYTGISKIKFACVRVKVPHLWMRPKGIIYMMRKQIFYQPNAIVCVYLRVITFMFSMKCMHLHLYIRARVCVFTFECLHIYFLLFRILLLCFCLTATIYLTFTTIFYFFSYHCLSYPSAVGKHISQRTQNKYMRSHTKAPSQVHT